MRFYPDIRNLRSTLTYRYHILAWTIFITYEVTLKAAITGSFHHPVDYFLHYCLYILLFYGHTHLILFKTLKEGDKKYYLLIQYIILEVILFFIFSFLISKYMHIAGIQAAAPRPFTGTFTYFMLYRFLYICGLSTAYWLAISIIRKERRLITLRNAYIITAKEREALRADLMQAEIAFIKSQINPHLLFNTLNFIYNEVRKVDQKAADHILSLAELMQYAMADNGHQNTVLLKDELAHIRNYISLQKLRHPCNLIFKTYVADAGEGQRIIPFVLMTIVENVFQHAELFDPKAIARITISYRNKLLWIQTKNKIRPDDRPGHSLGLDNLSKRMGQAYPGAYELIKTRTQNTYKLKLTVHLNQKK